MKNKLLTIREELKLTQAEISEKLEIAQSYYSALESGKKNITSKIAKRLFAKYSISPLWFFNSEGDIFISQNINKSDNSVGNIDRQNGGKTQGVMTGGFTGGNDELKYDGNYEDNKIDFYYRHSEYRLDKLLSVAINDFNDVFNNYMKLVDVLEKLNAPDYIKEKYNEKIDFNTYKKKIDDEIREFNDHITDKKLYKAVRLVGYEREIEHRIRLLYMLIDHVNRASNRYNKNL